MARVFFKRRVFACLAAVLAALAFCAARAAPVQQAVRVAVVFEENPRFYIDIFGPTIEHLRRRLPQLAFETREIASSAGAQDLSEGHFDFVISLSGFFASLQPDAGLRQIATRQAARAANASESIGSAFIVPAASRIGSVDGLRGKRIAARDSNSMEGWLIAAGEAIKAPRPESAFSAVTFTRYRFPDVLSLVEGGDADAAVLPACELERLEESGLVRPGQWRVLAARQTPMGCRSSTALYPGVVFASLPRASSDLVKSLTLELLNMPAMPDGSSWSIAGDFRRVNALFEALQIGPYAPKPWTVARVWHLYSREIILAVLLATGLLFHIFRVNSLVLQRTRELREAIGQRDRVAALARESLQRLSLLEKRGLVAQLSNIFAHELKQPLSTVVNYANGLKLYMQDKPADPVIAPALEEIVKEGRRATAIVDRVRVYARQKAREPLAACRLDQIASQAIVSFGAYDRGNHPVEVRAEPLRVKGDSLEIELLAINLLRNAAQAVEPLGAQGHLAMAVARVQDFAELSVEDNGPAVSDEKLEKMRSALQQSIKPDGLGLGLTIVFAIAERHGARVLIERRTPAGLAVRVRFPLEKEP